MAANATSDYNTAVGTLALSKLTKDGEAGNTAVGYNTGKVITTGTYNTLVGMQTGDVLTTASSSVFVGAEAGGTVTTGNANIGIGHNAMNGGVTTCDNNIAIGKT